jgi:hypothetical protein
LGCLKTLHQQNPKGKSMTANIENNNSTSVWKRAFDFIQTMEKASEYTPADRAIVDLNQKVSELEDTIRNLENKTH